MNVRATELKTPIGPLTLAFSGETVCAAIFADCWGDALPGLQRRFGSAPIESGPPPAEVTRRFEAYWAGDTRALDDLAVDPGGTPFQARVWGALRRIPAGRTMSYSELAIAVGAPDARRAVGAANGANPVWIAIPCHRVIRADGTLCGYGGGVERKRWLLAHER